MDRRVETKATSASARPSRRAVVGAFAAGGVLAFARPGLARDDHAERRVLVFVFLRGGMDGLSLCVPHGDGHLERLRKHLAVPRSVCTDLDGFFSLAPAAAALAPAYRAGELAFVHAIGSPDPSRSHFDAMRRMEEALFGAPRSGAASGWLGRALGQAVPRAAGTPAAPAGLALGRVLPRSLFGGPGVTAVSDAASFATYGREVTSKLRRQVLARMYSKPPLDAAEATIVDGGRATLAALRALGPVDFAPEAARHGTEYPDTPFGRRMREAAQLVRARLGIDAVQVDFGGWDDHADMGPTGGKLAGRLRDLAGSLAGFRADLGDELARITLVAFSEFGRRADENGSGGTDHGRGGVALVLGGGVDGGRVHGRWPGLGPEALDAGAVAVTTDYRDLLTELLAERHGVEDMDTVFPGHRPQRVGVVQKG